MWNILRVPDQPSFEERRAFAAVVAEQARNAELPRQGASAPSTTVFETFGSAADCEASVLNAILTDAQRDSLRYAVRSDTWHDGE